MVKIRDENPDVNIRTENLSGAQPETIVDDHYPFVTIIMPIRNEAAYIDRSLKAVLAQDYPMNLIEVLVVDGASTDKTKDIVLSYQKENPNIKLIDNPKKIVPSSLNLALRQAKGSIIVRVDGHCEIAPEYVRKCVRRLRQTRVDCVGGPIETIGESRIARTIALAMSSPFGVGGSPFRTVKNRSMLVDTVAFPAYTKQALEKAGPFDEELVRNQDDEYNYRLRELGGRVLLSPDIRSRYYSRSSLASLWRQYFQYGFWKVRIMQKHPKQMVFRQFIPPIFVAALLVSGLVAAIIPHGWVLLAAVSLSYILANLAASSWMAWRSGWQHVLFLPIVYAILHVSYGTGFLIGLAKFARRWSEEFKNRVSRQQVSDASPLIQKHIEKPVDFPSWITFLDNVARRTLDIVVSLIGLIVLTPVFLLLAILIKRDSPGPIFYWGPRVGRNGKIFKILKFRTMYEQEESYNGSRVTAQNDRRITPFGRWLRDTKVNELPQLWNVLIGEMSLVGPRPEDPQIAEKWSEELQLEILAVRPGITSPATVLYRNEEQLFHSKNIMDEYLRNIMPSKLRLDLLFIRHRTIFTDLDVIFWTAIILLPSLKRLTVPERLLYFGPLSQFTDRYLAWFFSDMLITMASVGMAGVIWRIDEPLDLGITLALGIAFAIAFLFSLINTLVGVNRIKWSHAQPGDVLYLALSSGLVTIALFLANLLWPGSPLLPPGMIIISGMFSFYGFVAVRYRSRLVTGVSNRWISLRGDSTSFLGERVLIVGAEEVAQFALWLLRNGNLAQAFTVIGMVDDDPRKNGMIIDGSQVIGETKDIPRLVETLDIGLILYAITEGQQEVRERIITTFQSIPARVIMMPDILDTLRAFFPSDEKDQAQLFGKVLENTTIDKLTGIYNSNQLLLSAERERLRAQRYDLPLSVLWLSVDYERPEGEPNISIAKSKVLQLVVENCQRNIREVDILGRYNNNELVIILPETDLRGAYRLAERLLREMTNNPLQTNYGFAQLSLKIGFAEDNIDFPDAVALINDAKTSLKAYQ